MRSKKPRRVKRPTRAKRLTRTSQPVRAKSARVEKPVRVERPVRVNPGHGTWILSICIICVMTAALLIASRKTPVDRGDVATLDSLREGHVEPPAPLVRDLALAPADSPRDNATGRVGPTEAPKTVVRTLAAASPATTPALKATPAVKTSTTDALPAVKTIPLVDASAEPHAAELNAPRDDETSTLVTMTGCLESDDQLFKLKNVTGSDAPTSRSWKSGFLRKRSASIEIAGTANGVSLTSHVGQRVALTGTLVDREMHVRSVQRIADACKQ